MVLGHIFLFLWHQVSLIAVPVFCTSWHSPRRNRKDCFGCLSLLGERTCYHICLSRTMHWHLIVLIRGLEQLNVGKLYHFRVHWAFNISISEILNQVKTALDSEKIVIENLLGWVVKLTNRKILLYLCISFNNQIAFILIYWISLKRRSKYTVWVALCAHTSAESSKGNNTESGLTTLL